MVVPRNLAEAQVSVDVIWDLFNSQEKLKTMLMQNFGETNKEYYGMLWYFLEWSIAAYFDFEWHVHAKFLRQKENRACRDGTLSKLFNSSFK